MKVKTKIPYLDSKTVVFEGEKVSLKNPTKRRIEELLDKGIVINLKEEEVDWLKSFINKMLDILDKETIANILNKRLKEVSAMTITHNDQIILKVTVNQLNKHVVQLNYFTCNNDEETYELAVLINTKEFPVTYDVVNSSRGRITLVDFEQIGPNLSYFFVASLVYMDFFKFTIADNAKKNEKICSMVPVRIFEKDPWEKVVKL